MQYILSLLPLLACPVGMGLLMWLLMRETKKQAPGEADQPPLDISSKSTEAGMYENRSGSLFRPPSLTEACNFPPMSSVL